MKIAYVTREEVAIDLEGETPKSRQKILHVVGMTENDPHWLQIVTGSRNTVLWQAGERNLSNGGGFVSSIFQTYFIAPYLERLEKTTGYKLTKLDEIQIKSIEGVFHTHIVENAFIRNGTLHALTITQAYPLQGKQFDTANDLSEAGTKKATRYVDQAIGQTECEPEFIETGRGANYKRNPKYGNITVHPAAINESLWQEIMTFWHSNAASDTQKAVLARLSFTDDRQKAAEPMPHLRNSNGLHLDNFNKSMTWDQFKALAKTPSPSSV